MELWLDTLHIYQSDLMCQCHLLSFSIQRKGGTKKKNLLYCGHKPRQERIKLQSSAVIIASHTSTKTSDHPGYLPWTHYYSVPHIPAQKWAKKSRSDPLENFLYMWYVVLCEKLKSSSRAPTAEETNIKTESVQVKKENQKKIFRCCCLFFLDFFGESFYF